ncbi:MAG: 30S ribosomal protein S17 [Candidatus Methylomirabilis sp.]|nr:30S ribosomal protein S17 [Deltaproteobacteria bacterium]
MTGVVTSNKMEKTIVVQVTRQFSHPEYKKSVRRRKKYYAHDEEGKAAVGDRVVIKQTRPLSKLKRWALEEIVHKAPIS